MSTLTIVHGIPMRDWLQEDVSTYVHRMRKFHTWGGATELAMVTKLYPHVTIHVYQDVHPGVYKRILTLGTGSVPVDLCFRGGCHYDRLHVQH